MKFSILMLLVVLSAPTFADSFKIQSKAYGDDKTIAMENVFNGFGCTGKNQSPDIEWSGVPEGTQSFAVTLYDPDAPTGSGWWHWTLFNIPAGTTKIAAGASGHRKKLPRHAVEGRTDFGKSGYGGPCPPPGDEPHHYILTVYALKVPKIDLNKRSPGAMVGYYLNQNSLAKAQVTARFGR